MNPDKFLRKKHLSISFLFVIILGLIGCGPVKAESTDTGSSSVDRGQLGAEDTVDHDINILGTIQVTGSTVVPPKTGEPTCLNAYLSVRDSIQLGSGEPVTVHFLLENNAKIPLYLLKWYTPLEGIAGDIFEVSRDGQEIPYMGILASRGNPTPESYIFLEAGESVSAEVNISEAYDFSKPGKYTIRFRSPRISHIAKSEGELAKTLDDLGPVNIPSNEVTLDVVSSSTGTGLPTRLPTLEAGKIISSKLRDPKSNSLVPSMLEVEEVRLERVWEQLQGQVFRVKEGIYEGAAFLLRNGNVLQLGESIGGKGLSSLVVSDLDQDGQSELLFTYMTGLSPGIGVSMLTRIGMFIPAYDETRIFEADIAYLGDMILLKEKAADVAARVAEPGKESGGSDDRVTIGYLSIAPENDGLSLVLDVNPDLRAAVKGNLLTNE